MYYLLFIPLQHNLWVKKQHSSSTHVCKARDIKTSVHVVVMAVAHYDTLTDLIPPTH